MHRQGWLFAGLFRSFIIHALWLTMPELYTEGFVDAWELIFASCMSDHLGTYYDEVRLFQACDVQEMATVILAAAVWIITSGRRRKFVDVLLLKWACCQHDVKKTNNKKTTQFIVRMIESICSLNVSLKDRWYDWMGRSCSWRKKIWSFDAYVQLVSGWEGRLYKFSPFDAVRMLLSNKKNCFYL